MSEEVFRGSWVPVNDSPHPELYKCPFCGEQVYIKRGMATYPTCPFCLSDMPEAEDFETPAELAERKAGNRAATGRKYCENREVNEARNAKLRAYRASLGEEFRAQRREYYAKNKEKINAQQRARYQKNIEKNRARSLQYYYDHREERLAAQKKWREENPDKAKEQQINAKGRTMREVEAHIRGISVDEIPEYDFWGGKGRNKCEQ